MGRLKRNQALRKLKRRQKSSEPSSPKEVRNEQTDDGGVLHALVRHEEEMKSQDQRRVREIRDQFENNAEHSVELLSELNELVARQNAEPSQFLAAAKKVVVPKVGGGTTRKVFDRGLPRIPSTYFSELADINNWDSMRLGLEQLGTTASEGFKTSQVFLAAMQVHKSIDGGKLCSVSAHDTSSAEQSDAMEKLTGGDIAEALPSLAFWFKRRIQNTNTHFVVATTHRQVTDGNIEYQIELSDRGVVDCQLASRSKETVVGSLTLVGFNNMKADPNVEEYPYTTAAIPLIEEVSILDGFLSCYPEGERDRIAELYHGDGKIPSSREELDMLSSLSTIRAVINCMAAMMAEPEYVQTKKVSQRTFDSDAGGKKGKRGKVSGCNIMELRTEVEDDPPHGATALSGGARRREHWRRAHYVRKPHSVRWRKSNPEQKELYFPDGRPYHICRIKPTKVNSGTPRKEKDNADQ